MLFKFVVFPYNYRNTSGSLREREIAVLNTGHVIFLFPQRYILKLECFYRTIWSSPNLALVLTKLERRRNVLYFLYKITSRK